MGYDFILFRLRRPIAPCPARIPPDFGAGSVVSMEDPTPVHDAMRASPLFDPGSVRFDGTRFTWRTPDGGTLDVDAIAHGMNIDTHAHWDHVAELFDVVLAVWPDTALFDLQKAHVHDAASFRAFVERAYREAALKAAERAADKAAPGPGTEDRPGQGPEETRAQAPGGGEPV